MPTYDGAIVVKSAQHPWKFWLMVHGFTSRVLSKIINFSRRKRWGQTCPSAPFGVICSVQVREAGLWSTNAHHCDMVERSPVLCLRLGVSRQTEKWAGEVATRTSRQFVQMADSTLGWRRLVRALEVILNCSMPPFETARLPARKTEGAPCP